MKKTGFVLSLLLSIGAVAQSVETIPFRALLSSANESPAPPSAASGAATVWLHVVRDASGKVVSGSADAVVSYKFTPPVTITAMHIHKGAAGVNGGIVLPFGIATTADAGGVGVLPKVQTVFPTAAVTLDTINGLIADPSQFYFNVHTTDSPGGAMRGQVQRADMMVRMGIMRPENETPPFVGKTWLGIGSATLLTTRDANSNLTGGYVIFDMAYTGFTPGVNFTGFHIHSGAAGVAGPVTIDSGLTPVAAGADGSGVLHYENEINLSRAGAVDTVNGLLFSPSSFYINAHTTEGPGGAVRSQLAQPDRMDFQVTMLPANETPAISDATSTPGKVSIYTLRNKDGSIAAGTVIFDVNPQGFPADTQYTGLHIHDGAIGVAGPVTVDSRISAFPILATASGNVYRIVTVGTTAAGLKTLNDLVSNPEAHYVNIHTAVNKGGANRAPLIAANTKAPVIQFAETGVLDPSQTTLAPGGFLTLFGTDLAKVGTNLDGFYSIDALPAALNGVTVTVGGKTAPLLFVSPNQINAQTPFDVAPGTQPVVVTTANGPSTPFNVTVAATAPVIFYDSVGAIAQRWPDYSLIRPGNAAKANDILIVYVTGLGQTSPALETGKLVGTGTIYNAGTVTAKIGGQPAQVLYAVATPGFSGLYQVALRVPSGLSSGNASMTLSMGSQTSNAVQIAIQ